MKPEYLSRIKSLFLFRDVSESLLDEMLSDRRVETADFAAEDIIYDESNYRKSLGVVLTGKAEVQAVKAGRTVPLNLLNPPRLFGAASLFQEEKGYVARIIALAPSKILFIPQDLLIDFMRRDFKLVENYLTFLSQRIRFLNKKIAGFTQSGAEAKLARYLLDVAVNQETDSFLLPTSVQNIAKILNLGRASLYRALDTLSDLGYIVREGKTVRLLNISGLKSLCL